MRNKEQKRDLSVQAIAGTHVVLLGMDLPGGKVPGSARGSPCEERIIPRARNIGYPDIRLSKSVEPSPPPGILYSTRQHPIQGFTWSDFSAKPEHDYTYEVFALRDAAGQFTRVRKGGGEDPH